jgi:predicted ester cyclase
MNTETNKAVVRRFYERVVNTGDISILESLLSPDYTERHDGVVYAVGIDGAKNHVLGVRQTYPDLQLTIERQIAEGEWVATCATATGTHAGAWLGMKPTGKRVTYTVVNVDRVVDGRIVEHGGAANLLGPLLQIGAVRVSERADES